jgi:hypothetical protein
MRLAFYRESEKFLECGSLGESTGFPGQGTSIWRTMRSALVLSDVPLGTDC